MSAAEARPVAAPTGPGPAGATPTRLVLRRFRRHRLALASGVLLIALALACLAAPLVARLLDQDANLVDLLARFAGPGPGHPLGTDELGRDLLLRLLQGGRVSLFVGLVGALAAAILGTAIGLVAGYLGGRVDALLMRLTDAVIALPLLPLLIVLAAVDLTKLGLPADWVHAEAASLYRILVIVALVGWTTVARLVRGATLSVRAHDYVRAADALGAGPVRIMTAAYPAQRGLADHRRHDPVGRQRDPDRIDPQLPRPRHPAAAAQLGQHADQRPGADLAGTGAGDLPRAC